MMESSVSSYMRIQSLPVHVANQIAAGEVIERPASVVKELLENAVDAGATILYIEIGFGGLNQITVSDNGMGIHESDLFLAVAPHATSKLRTLDDLSTLSTMGFRGEALASIAAVSRLTIQSRPQGVVHAMSLSTSLATSEKKGWFLSPCARNIGTTVDIRDLFFNAPVRKKFLKTAALEYLAIETVVKRFACSVPSVAITLVHNGSIRLRLPAAPCEKTETSRLRQLLGKKFVDHAMRIMAVRGDLCLSGWISNPLFARSQQDRQWLYINRRMVRDKLMLHAMKQVYEPRLSPGRYPTCLLYLTLPADEVDVNVHPTKHEVRFHDARAVHDFIRSSLEELMAQWTPPSVITKSSTPESPSSRGVNATTDALSWAQIEGLSISSRHMILKVERNAYLVDIMRLRQSELLLSWSHKKPLVNRLLLVPISILVSDEQYEALQHHQQQLAYWGVEITFLEKNEIAIHTIPCDLPLLDLRALLNNTSHYSTTEANYPQLLLQADAWSIFMILDDEKNEWILHWLNHNKPYAILLDEKRCQELCACLD